MSAATPSHTEREAVRIVGAVLDAVRAFLRPDSDVSEPQFITTVIAAVDPMDPEVLAAVMTRTGHAPSRALLDVIAERQRQISAEGWSLDHDDSHRNGDLAAAAACYALSAGWLSGYGFPWLLEGRRGCPDLWPWERAAWKPKDPRRDLVRAGALILAEIERIDRASARHASDCAVHNAPAYPPGPCDCGAA